MDYSERFTEINKRMDYLKNFYPFFKIYTSSAIQKYDFDLPYLALDILTLLIEKGRLQGRALSPEEIESHIQSTMEQMYPGRSFDIRNVARTVLGLLETDLQGMLYQFQYQDPLRNKQIDHYTHLVEYDVKERAYRITDSGLDFMISIKELPEESKISVSLILFKKQIESGSFKNALDTIRDLNLEVQRKKRKKEELLDKLMYGDFDIVEEYEKYTSEVLSQLTQEHELFNQVRSTLEDLTENREKITSNPNYAGTEEDFIVIRDIATELKYGYDLHNTLLKDYTDFPSQYERICNIRVNSLFERRYQFQEAMETHIRANLPNEVHIVEMHPLLRPTILKKFNLFKIFEAQPVFGKKSELIDVRIIEDWTDKKLIDEIIEQRQIENFSVYTRILLASLMEENELDLPTYLAKVNEIVGKDGLENIDLIPFLVELNSGYEVLLHSHESDSGVTYNPFETTHDLSALHKSQGRDEPLQVAILSASEEIDLSPHSKIRVIADPNVRVPIGGKEDVYISNIRFILEVADEL